MNGFDDYLNLKNAQLHSCQLIVFTGVSGSGKSSAIQWLLENHPDFENTSATHVSGGGEDWPVPEMRNGLVVVDDIISKKELFKVRQLLLRGNRVLLAAHVHPVWFAILRGFWATKVFRVDQNREKLARYLQARKVEFTQTALNSFCNEYGASYLDLAHILERYPGSSFDRALRLFRKYCRMEQPTLNS